MDISITFSVPSLLAGNLTAENNNVLLVDTDQAYNLLQTVLDLVTAQNARNAITDDFCAD